MFIFAFSLCLVVDNVALVNSSVWKYYLALAVSLVFSYTAFKAGAILKEEFSLIRRVPFYISSVLDKLPVLDFLLAATIIGPQVRLITISIQLRV